MLILLVDFVLKLVMWRYWDVCVGFVQHSVSGACVQVREADMSTSSTVTRVRTRHVDLHYNA